jgi:hypothetical protein
MLHKLGLLLRDCHSTRKNDLRLLKAQFAENIWVYYFLATKYSVRDSNVWKWSILNRLNLAENRNLEGLSSWVPVVWNEEYYQNVPKQAAMVVICCDIHHILC